MNHKLRTKNKQGFTLVEVLVVSALIFTVGVMVVQLFFSSLKGGVKSDFLNLVKEQGNYAQTVMERMIMNSLSIAPTDCTATSLKIQNPDMYYTTFRCVTGTPTRIASVSGTATVEMTTYSLTSDRVRVDCSSLFRCDLSAGKVGIEFTVYPNIPDPKQEEIAQRTFETTVTLRNY